MNKKSWRYLRIFSILLVLGGTAFAWLTFRTPEVRSPSADVSSAPTKVLTRDVTFTDMIGMTVGELYAKAGYDTDRKPKSMIIVVPMNDAAIDAGIDDRVITAACGTPNTIEGNTVWLAVYGRGDIPVEIIEQMGRKSILLREALIERVPQCPDIAQSIAY